MPEVLTQKNTVQKQLINSQNPPIRYRALTELADIPKTDPEIVDLKSKIELLPDVVQVFKSMLPDGYWLQKNPRTGKITGDGVEYGAFATTHFILAYLSELGFTKEHPLVFKASERYLNLIDNDGNCWNNMSCLNGLNIRTFVRIGYYGDERLQKVIDGMLNTPRKDFGYLCDMHEKRSKNNKSCYRGAAKMLLAFSEIPELYNHPRVKQLIDYFLKRDAIFNSQKTNYVNSDITRFSFPIIWRANTWEVVYAMSKMGYGNLPHLDKAWELIESRKNDSGKILLDWSPQQIPFKFGKRNQESEWLMFYFELANKYRSMN
jgi:hypothetical protein